MLIPYVLSTNGITLSSLNAVGWVNLLIVGLVHTGITYCLYFSSLKELPGQEAAILSYIDPLVAVLVSVTLLGESMTAMQVIGGALILGFTLLNELSPTPKAKRSNSRKSRQNASQTLRPQILKASQIFAPRTARNKLKSFFVATCA